MLKMENLPFCSPHSNKKLQRSHCISPSYQKPSYVHAWPGSLIYGGDCSDGCLNFTPFITQELKLAQQMADRHGYGSRGCYVVCTTALAIFHHAALQVSKPAQNIRPIRFNCTVSNSWIQALSGGLAPRKTHSEHTWLKFLHCLFF